MLITVDIRVLTPEAASAALVVDGWHRDFPKRQSDTTQALAGRCAR
jgi:hypothetical protein